MIDRSSGGRCGENVSVILCGSRPEQFFVEMEKPGSFTVSPTIAIKFTIDFNRDTKTILVILSMF
jgi:hypothetical protein